VDTSVLIGCWHRHYPPEVFPSLWKRFEELIAAGIFRAVDEVLVELEVKSDDPLIQWTRAQRGLFAPADDDVQTTVTEILQAFPGLVRTTAQKSDADAFVIALALQGEATVVTEERFSRNPQARPKIPDVCRDRGVDCISTLDLLRREGWTF